MNAFRIVELADDQPGGFRPRGAALELWRYKGREAIIAGPAETGKTYASLQKLDALLWKYPGSQAVLVRKVRDTIYTSCLQTYTRKVLLPGRGVRAYGGNHPQWFDYANGSRLWLAGMDDPGKALSSERDFIYVNQAEELKSEDWQVLTTRATGRAGNAPYAQTFGDCNPGPPTHWIKRRELEGKLRLFYSTHKDNPTLYGEDGEITEQGRRTIASLEALTGVLRARLYEGRWVQAEGAVYPGWRPAVHVIDPFPIPEHWPRLWAVDFGYTHPFAWLGCALDGDGRLHVYRQIYHTKRLVRDHAARIRTLTHGEPRPLGVVADSEDPEGRATLEAELGVATMPAYKYKSRDLGIQAVSERLVVRPDGKPRLLVHRGGLDEIDAELAEAGKPTCLEAEFESYVWADSSKRDVPLKENDDALDALRYLVYALDAPAPPDEGPSVVRA